METMSTGIKEAMEKTHRDQPLLEADPRFLVKTIHSYTIGDQQAVMGNLSH